MTFSLVGMCRRTGMLGGAVTTSSIGVGSRCPYARAGDRSGAHAAPYRPDPGSPEVSTCWRAGRSAQETVDALVDGNPTIGWRQLAVIDRTGGTAFFHGNRIISIHNAAQGASSCAIGNIVRNESVPRAMVDVFEAAPDEHLAERLVRGLEAGEAAGGELRQVKSGGPAGGARALVPAGRSAGRVRPQPVGGAAVSVGGVPPAGRPLRPARGRSRLHCASGDVARASRSRTVRSGSAHQGCPSIAREYVRAHRPELQPQRSSAEARRSPRYDLRTVRAGEACLGPILAGCAGSSFEVLSFDHWPGRLATPDLVVQISRGENQLVRGTANEALRLCCGDLRPAEGVRHELTHAVVSPHEVVVARIHQEHAGGSLAKSGAVSQRTLDLLERSDLDVLEYFDSDMLELSRGAQHKFHSRNFSRRAEVAFVRNTSPIIRCIPSSSRRPIMFVRDSWTSGGGLSHRFARVRAIPAQRQYRSDAGTVPSLCVPLEPKTALMSATDRWAGKNSSGSARSLRGNERRTASMT